jgi:hypothetical protein
MKAGYTDPKYGVIGSSSAAKPEIRRAVEIKRKARPETNQNRYAKPLFFLYPAIDALTSAKDDRRVMYSIMKFYSSGENK